MSVHDLYVVVLVVLSSIFLPLVLTVDVMILDTVVTWIVQCVVAGVYMLPFWLPSVAAEE